MDIALILLSFVAGIFTVLAPCVIPLLPVIISSSTTSAKWVKPAVIIGSISLGIFVFTIAIREISFALGLPDGFWSAVAGVVVIIYGFSLVFPLLWPKFLSLLRIEGKANNLLQKSSEKEGLLGYALMGISLGFVFNSCSPTYALIMTLFLVRMVLVQLCTYLLIF